VLKGSIIKGTKKTDGEKTGILISVILNNNIILFVTSNLVFSSILSGKYQTSDI